MDGKKQLITKLILASCEATCYTSIILNVFSANTKRKEKKRQVTSLKWLWLICTDVLDLGQSWWLSLILHRVLSKLE